MLLVGHPTAVQPTIGLGGVARAATIPSSSTSSPSPITCQVFDASTGKPAAGVEVQLQELKRESSGKALFRFDPLAVGTTDAHGYCTDLLPTRGSEDAKRHDAELKKGTYKVIFRTKEYFERSGRPSLYPWIEISFTIEDSMQDYHLPLHVTPHSFTTHSA